MPIPTTLNKASHAQCSKKQPSELTVGQVSKRSGIAISALHFYESKGLIHSQRTAGNQRRYPRHVLRTLSIIKVAQKAGLSLEDLRQYFAMLPADGKISSAAWQQLSQAWQQELNARIKRLTRLRDELGSCIGCGCLSQADCPLRNPEDRLSAKGAGAHFLERP